MKAQIPWLRVFVEGVVIVGSILLAFGIEAWWEGRQQRTEVTEILGGLHVEFSRIADGLQSRRERWDSMATEIGVLLAASEANYDLPLEQSRTSLAALIYPSTFDPGSGVRDALVASGRLELIDGVDLRNSLVAWEGVLREVQDNEIAMRDFILNQLSPYLAAHGALVGVSPTGRVRWRGATEANELAAYRAILRDPEFFGLVSVRYSWLDLTVDEYEAASEFVADIVRLVSEELARD